MFCMSLSKDLKKMGLFMISDEVQKTKIFKIFLNKEFKL